MDRRRHLNLTYQVTCDWQLSQFLRCFVIKPLPIGLCNVVFVRQFEVFNLKYHSLVECRLLTVLSNASVLILTLVNTIDVTMLIIT